MNSLLALCSEAVRLVSPPDLRNQRSNIIRGHPLYTVWASMKRRCYCLTNSGYADYGGRGIRVADRWLLKDTRGFRNFLSDMGPRPVGASLERIDVNGNYGPKNCRWASNADQAINRRNTRWISFNGETKLIGTWAKELGLANQSVLSLRIKKWGLEKALSTKGKTNGIDAAAIAKKSKTHCKRGHEYNNANTKILPNGGRDCRVCRKLAMRLRRENNRAV